MIDVDGVYSTLTSRRLTHEQKLMGLAKHAENSLGVLSVPSRTRHFFNTGAINDLFEGGAPYRPRYIQPNYELFVKQGSEFLDLRPPMDLDELLFALMILYRHVPSITNFPVWLGSLDELIDPFIGGLGDEEVCAKLRLFFTYLDRTITDSFCHANLGPRETRAGRLILKTERDLGNAVPNLTIKYDPDITPDDFMEQALLTSLACSNPAICNHRANSGIYDRYGVCSCYNILPVQGGAYTLTRVTLSKLAQEARNRGHFLDDLLPECLGLIGAYMNERIRFLADESGFFESSFLVKEGLIARERFVGMFGVTGLAKCVNTLLAERDLVYGRDSGADELGVVVMEKIKSVVDELPALYSPISGGRFLLHAQVGLDSDSGVTSGVRIPAGGEPESFTDHLRHCALYHKYFPAGVGDIFPIADGAARKPDALLDVVKGAFASGVKYMSFYAGDAELVRITGYLAKRGEMEKFNRGEAVLQNTTQLGAPAYDVNNLARRRVRMV